jgi:hypothetical protein
MSGFPRLRDLEHLYLPGLDEKKRKDGLLVSKHVPLTTYISMCTAVSLIHIQDRKTDYNYY